MASGPLTKLDEPSALIFGNTLWWSFDGYAASAGERSVNIQLVAGTHTLEMRNRVEKNPASSGYKIQFQQLQVLATTYTERTIDYTYDALARLIEADVSAALYTIAV